MEGRPIVPITSHLKLVLDGLLILPPDTQVIDEDDPVCLRYRQPLRVGAPRQSRSAVEIAAGLLGSRFGFEPVAAFSAVVE